MQLSRAILRTLKRENYRSNPPDLLNTDKPDERAIMTYVSCYYHAFQGAMQVGKRKKIGFLLFLPRLKSLISGCCHIKTRL